jgi:hypothetical protein
MSTERGTRGDRGEHGISWPPEPDRELTIHTIIPATGWWAVFAEPQSNGSHREPLSCWALVEEDGMRTIEGMSADLGQYLPVTTERDFVGYLHESQSLSIFTEEIQRVNAELREKYGEPRRPW